MTYKKDKPNNYLIPDTDKNDDREASEDDLTSVAYTGISCLLMTIILIAGVAYLVWQSLESIDLFSS